MIHYYDDVLGHPPCRLMSSSCSTVVTRRVRVSARHLSPHAGCRLMRTNTTKTTTEKGTGDKSTVTEWAWPCVGCDLPTETSKVFGAKGLRDRGDRNHQQQRGDYGAVYGWLPFAKKTVIGPTSLPLSGDAFSSEDGGVVKAMMDTIVQNVTLY